MQAAGFVLVGGHSTRMGQDKALLSSGGYPLVTEIARQVREAAGSVALVGKPERYQSLGLDCIVDFRPDLGPLAGIEAALESKRGEMNLIVACDMPGLDIELLRALLQHAADTGAPCIVTQDSNGAIHPLCGVYRSGCLPAVKRALDERRLRLMDLVEELRAIPVDIEGTIWNVNTPQDWSAWRERHFSHEEAPLRLPNGD